MCAKIASDYSDSDLLQALKEGVPGAVRVWFARYKPVVAAVVASKLESQADAEELVQQTFINALRQLPLFRGEASLKTWLLAIARHEVADYYRKKYAKKALRTLPLSSFTELLLNTPIDDAHAVSVKVQHVLEKMTDRSRELLLQKYVDGKKVFTIAQDFGRSVKSVESELFRARSEFRSLWAEVE